MFQTLYQRTKANPNNNLTFPWPATYADSIMPIEKNPYTLKLSGCLEVPRPEKKASEKPEDETEHNDPENPPPPLATELTLDWETLLKLPKTTQTRRTVSAQGWSYKTTWEGITLEELIKKVNLKPEASWLKQTNLSGHTEYLPLEVALSGKALLCYQANETLLPPLYGGPLWLMVFNRFNYKGLGQITELAFIDKNDVQPGFWETKGYSAEGAITPGNYYAFDFSDHRPIETSDEVTQY